MLFQPLFIVVSGYLVTILHSRNARLFGHLDVFFDCSKIEEVGPSLVECTAVVSRLYGGCMTMLQVERACLDIISVNPFILTCVATKSFSQTCGAKESTLLSTPSPTAPRTKPPNNNRILDAGKRKGSFSQTCGARAFYSLLWKAT
jgi:hypothetical protein